MRAPSEAGAYQAGEVYRIMHCLKQVGLGPDSKPGNEYGHNYRITGGGP